MHPFKNTTKIIISIIFVILIIIPVYLSFFEHSTIKNEDNKDKYNEKFIDNKISPLTNQGLILEINRIRHRGLLDEIMKFGTSWRKKPTFYVVIDIDNRKYSSYEEYGFTYNTWDTIGQEFRHIRDVEEEQATSKVKIIIIEKVKKGIFRTNEIEKAKIEVIYDYKIGRWSGDDSFNDYDGYGHYMSDTFEVWFNIYQTDFDQDGIPYWTEVNILNTNTQVDDSKLDPDQDGIPTSWEWRWNYNPFIWDDHVNLDPDIDGLENIEEYQMCKWFANPFSQDIYIEVDGMKKGGLFDKDHILYEESKQIVIERFCRHNINVYIDDGWPGGPSNSGGELLPYVDEKKSWNSGMFLQYYKHHFPDERKEIFRYIMISGNLGGGYCGNAEFNRYDTILIGTNTKAILKLWLAFTPRTERIMLASVFLHELGHSLGIGPNTIEGCDNSSYVRKFIPTKDRKRFLEEWGNYKSVMNYYYLYNKNIVDYSDGSHGYNDQNDWEKFYLPLFQIETNVVVDPFYYPITKEGIDENVSIKLDGWNYNRELTQKFKDFIHHLSKIDPKRYNWSVYVKTDEADYLSNRTIRIYVKPNVPIAVWSLFKEGYLDEKGNIN